MPKGLVLGVNGQDGSYAAEALLRRGYDVVGIGRQTVSRYVDASDQFSYVQLDLENRETLSALLHRVQPDVVFHLAAIHGAAGFSYEPVIASMLAVNVVVVHTILEYARVHRPQLRLLYANSAKIFPSPLTGSISEQTPTAATCLYSVGKIAALDIIRHYRKQHGIAGANLILFNHESPRRPREFFVPMLARGLAASIANPQHQFTLKTLDFLSDWSAAEELMDIAVDICEQAPTEDFVLASGVTLHAREAVREAFARYDLDYSRHIVESLPPQTVGPMFQVQLDHLQTCVGRRPKRTAQSLIDDLVLAAQLSRQ